MNRIVFATLAAVVVLLGITLWRAIAGRTGRAPWPQPGVLVTLDDVRRWLATTCELNVRAYSSCEFGRERDTRNISVIVGEHEAEELLRRVPTGLGPGLVAYVGTSRWLGDEQPGGVELVVGRGQSQFDILRLARSAALNYDLETEQVIPRFQELHRRFGIDIWRAETDTVVIRFDSLPADVRGLAAELYEFCPDIVDQGCGSVNALTEGIEANKAVPLWWD